MKVEIKFTKEHLESMKSLLEEIESPTIDLDNMVKEAIESGTTNKSSLWGIIKWKSTDTAKIKDSFDKINESLIGTHGTRIIYFGHVCHIDYVTFYQDWVGTLRRIVSASNVTDLTSKPTEFNGCELHHLNKISEALIKMEERDAKQ